MCKEVPISVVFKSSKDLDTVRSVFLDPNYPTGESTPPWQAMEREQHSQTNHEVSSPRRVWQDSFEARAVDTEKRETTSSVVMFSSSS